MTFCSIYKNLNVLARPVRVKRFMNFQNIGSFYTRQHERNSHVCRNVITRSNPFLHQNNNCGLFLLHKFLCTPANLHLVSGGTDPISCKILDQHDSSELLDLLGKLDQRSLMPEHTWLFTSRLLHCHYEGLTSELSWLQSNIHVAYIQLNLRNDVQKMAASVLNHANYSLWHSLLERDFNTLTDRQLADCFMSLFYLGSTFEDPLLQNIFFLAREKLLYCDIQSLSTMSYILKPLPGYDFVSIRKMLQRLEGIIDSLNPVEISEEDLAAVATLCLNTAKFSNNDLMQKFMDWFLKSISRPEVLTKSDNVCIFLRMIPKLLLNGVFDKNCVQELLSTLTDACYSLTDSLNSDQIAEVCSTLKTYRNYKGKFANLVEQQACSLLTDQSRLCDVTNLMYTLRRETSQETVRMFQGALHSRLIRCKDVDIIILSNIAECLIDLTYVSNDLLEVYQKQVVEQADDIITYISRFNKIIKLLLRRRFVNQEDQEKFMSVLVRHVDHQHGLHLHSISSLATFLLPFSNKVIPDDVFKKLISAIPKWKEVELYRLTMGINSMQQPLTGPLKRQMSQILSMLHTSITERLDSVETIDYLYQLTLGLVIHNRSPDPSLTHRLMGMYTKFTDNLNVITLIKVAQTFYSVCYYLPEVYDDMVKFIVDNQDTMDDSKITWVVSACSKIGYQPQLGTELLNISKKVYRRLFAQKDYKSCVQLLNNLSIIQLYPEEELEQFFTLDNMEALERYFEENPLTCHSVERSMMVLNRNVVIECPQLGIPWFHEQFCLDNIAGNRKKLSAPEEKMRRDVYRALCEILGGQKFLRSSCYSNYFYEIDFEFTLDSKGRPVPINMLKEKSNENVDEQSMQKVAVRVLDENSYCYDSKQLLGVEQLRTRHLEILGYKHIDVPNFEWFSMGLTDWKSKLAYLQSKVNA